MERIPFGRTDLKVSPLCLGTMSMGSSTWKAWVQDEAEALPILRHALDLGINFYDMADWYSLGRNEEVVARNLLRMTRREQLVLATKVFYPMSDDPADRGLSAAHIATSIDRSLQRMGTDYVDLYVIHAFDTATGKELWKTRLGTSVQGFPIAFAVGGKQYIAVPVGLGGGSPRQVPRTIEPDVKHPQNGNALYVFARPDKR